VEEKVTILRSEYEGLKHEIAELRSLVEQLRLENSLLKGSRSSRTSSIAPSQDIGRSNQISLRVPSGKKSGGQLGHVGCTLSLSGTPDAIIDHRPLVCAHCGEDLDGVVCASFTCRQSVELPRDISPLFIEHRSHVTVCPSCQFENRGVFPAHLRAPIQYAPQIEAMAGYLSVYQYLPYKRICDLFKDFFRLPLSEGSIDTFLDNLSEKSTPAYESIQDRILQSEVVGSDETGCRVGGKKHLCCAKCKHWFHVWQTSLLTFIVSFAGRGHSVFEKYFSDGFIKSFYVSDCWASQLKVSAKAHQLCLHFAQHKCMAHLLRELTNFVENLKSDWSAQMKTLFMSAIELKKKMTKNDYLHSPPQVAALNKKLDELLQVDFSKFHSKEQAFIKRLTKHRQSILVLCTKYEVFTFLTCQKVPPDNNASERAIRNVKVKTKVSGQFRNKDGKGADRYAKIRSVIDTTIKNGQDVYATLVCLANGKLLGVPE
jgi:transposase